MNNARTTQPASLALSAGLRQPFLRLIRKLPPELFAYRLRMGGGSILEARFAHRRSTDIDLHMSPADLNDLLKVSNDPWQFVVVCATVCQSDAQFALSRLGQQDRRRIAEDLAAAPKNLHAEDPNPVIMPAFDVQLAGLSQIMAEAVRTGNLAALPAVRRLAPFEPDEREERGLQP